MPPIAILVLNGLTAALTAAPQITELVVKAKDFFASLAGNGLITAEQQDQVDARIDQIVEAAKQGRLPASWDVEPDPE